MLKLIVCGACGRMGRAIISCAAEEKGLALVGAIEREGHPCAGKDAGDIAGVGTQGVAVTSDLSRIAKGCDLIVDFSSHETSARNAEIAASCGKPIVIGTTGMSDEEMMRIKDASRSVACLVAPNMSIGVNLLFRLADEAARALGDEYDVEIIEVHHRFKKDAPSGTAKRLAQKVAHALGRDPEKDIIYGRKGETGERPKGQIALHAIRQGDVIGEHVVSFASLGERVELVHRAHSRETFARGALRAAKWIIGRKPGLYEMQDVLGENPKSQVRKAIRRLSD
ncbi:MAG: 4-hydroxy-tetrahydrodipicolinate reductase [Candidatus Aureabacteria bacterium]|nr:4-hydroxy-tetrahydrodipicolinate reductase [Candidatus Auribacterota bacterium]